MHNKYATTFNLGEAYPQGVFIDQDWYNLSDKPQPLNQNFKIVDWRDFQKILK
ncbi:phytase [Psychromonas arctica]|uniref:phytase n=1 Tax=Psychromonas arctica TaxID=168275 RepID=UPI003CC98C91